MLSEHFCKSKLNHLNINFLVSVKKKFLSTFSHQIFNFVESEFDGENDGCDGRAADDEVEDDDQIPPDHHLVVRDLAKFRQVFWERF